MTAFQIGIPLIAVGSMFLFPEQFTRSSSRNSIATMFGTALLFCGAGVCSVYESSDRLLVPFIFGAIGTITFVLAAYFSIAAIADWFREPPRGGRFH